MRDLTELLLPTRSLEGASAEVPVGRQARVRREYAAWYPTLSVSTWTPAKTVARTVARQLLEGEPHWAQGPRWEPGPRILDDRHFDFHGGAEGRAPTARTRRGDPVRVEDAPRDNSARKPVAGSAEDQSSA